MKISLVNSSLKTVKFLQPETSGVKNGPTRNGVETTVMAFMAVTCYW